MRWAIAAVAITLTVSGNWPHHRLDSKVGYTCCNGMHTTRTVRSEISRCTSWDAVLQCNKSGDLFWTLDQVVTPFAPWFLADFYFGTEIEDVLGQGVLKRLQKRGLKALPNCLQVPELSIVYVQSDKLHQWVQSCLPVLRGKIILITGKWHLPQVFRTPVTDFLVNSSKIVLWASQNPIYDASEKYTPLPYGFTHESVLVLLRNAREYSLERNHWRFEKATVLSHLGLSQTSPLRTFLPSANRVDHSKYFEEISKAQFLISPVGDRADCYRHWEAIAFDTIPVCNCPSEYKHLFGSSMVFATLEQLQNFIEHPTLLLPYVGVYAANKELLLMSYWKQEIVRLSANRPQQ